MGRLMQGGCFGEASAWRDWCRPEKAVNRYYSGQMMTTYMTGRA